MSTSALAIVVPVYNEAERICDSIVEIAAHTNTVTGAEFSLIVVDDGSADSTVEVLHRLNAQTNGPKLRVLELSRHYGKEAAIHAGLQAARNFDAVIVMDGDLEHPPALIAEMIEHWRRGSLVVEGVKASRGDEPRSRSISAKIYYSLFYRLTGLDISTDTDFKLLDKKVLDQYCELPEKSRFFRGLIKWMGIPSTQLPFDIPAGKNRESSWGGMALVRYAISTISSFTSFPLQLVTLLGLLTFLISLFFGGIAVYDKLTGNAVDGFTTVILLILIIGSILMFSLGLIGIYLGKIFDEIKQRPNFVLKMDADADRNDES